MHPTPLSSLADRRAARVVSVCGDGLLRERLVELGFVAGVEVEILRRAAFGGPVQVRVRGGMIALRLDEAGCVQVDPAAAVAAAPAPEPATAPPAPVGVAA